MALQHKIIILTLLSQSFLCMGMENFAHELMIQDMRTFGASVQKTCTTSARKTNSLFEKHPSLIQVKKQNLCNQNPITIEQIKIFKKSAPQQEDNTVDLTDFFKIERVNSALMQAKKQNLCNQNPITIQQTKIFKKSAPQQEDNAVDLTDFFKIERVNSAAKFQGSNEELYYLASALDASINKDRPGLVFCYLLKATEASKKNKTQLDFHDLSHALDANNKNGIKVDLTDFHIPLELNNANDYTKYIAGYIRIRDKMASNGSLLQTNTSSSTTQNNRENEWSQTRKRKPQANSNVQISHKEEETIDLTTTFEKETKQLTPVKEIDFTPIFHGIDFAAKFPGIKVDLTDFHIPLELNNEKNIATTAPIKNPHVKQLLDDEPETGCTFGKCLSWTTAYTIAYAISTFGYNYIKNGQGPMTVMENFYAGRVTW